MTDSDDQKIYLDGYIDVPADRMQTIVAALPVHIALTHEETGCVSFEVVPCQTVKGRFLVSEILPINRHLMPISCVQKLLTGLR